MTTSTLGRWGTARALPGTDAIEDITLAPAQDGWYWIQRTTGDWHPVLAWATGKADRLSSHTNWALVAIDVGTAIADDRNTYVTFRNRFVNNTEGEFAFYKGTE